MFLKSFDIFGSGFAIKMNKSDQAAPFVPGTICGGILSSIIVLAAISELAFEFYDISKKSGTTLDIKTRYLTDKALE